jgi:hypothetical protein
MLRVGVTLRQRWRVSARLLTHPPPGQSITLPRLSGYWDDIAGVSRMAFRTEVDISAAGSRSI